jgi:hypothetical protein
LERKARSRAAKAAHRDQNIFGASDVRAEARTYLRNKSMSAQSDPLLNLTPRKVRAQDGNPKIYLGGQGFVRSVDALASTRRTAEKPAL